MFSPSSISLCIRARAIETSNFPSLKSTLRAYSTTAKQGTKKKMVKRTLKDMPGYKKKLEERLKEAKDEFQPEHKFIKLFGPDSNYPEPPPTPKPAGPYDALFPGESDVPKETEILLGELDREFERLKGKAAIALQDPDMIIYDSLVQYRIQELEYEWLASPGPVTKESNEELKKKIDEVIFETDAEFDEYFAERPKMTKLELRKMRQFFLNEMGGRIHFFPQDKWKLQVIDPKYDLEKYPLTLKERLKLFKLPTSKLAENPKLLYRQYSELALHVLPDTKQLALPTERILGHFEMRKHKEKLEEMDKKDLEAELEDMEFEKDMLFNASTDSRGDEGDFSPDDLL